MQRDAPLKGRARSDETHVTSQRQAKKCAKRASLACEGRAHLVDPEA
jgi:hypothetical protein